MNKLSGVFLVLTLLLFGCSSSDSDDPEVMPVNFNLASVISNGADESSTEFWDCTFDDAATPELESGRNTVTFWDNGRGITGDGSLYDWSIVGEDRLEGAYDNGERRFIFEMFEFDSDNNQFTAQDASIRNPGTAEEVTINFNANCTRESQ